MLKRICSATSSGLVLSMMLAAGVSASNLSRSYQSASPLPKGYLVSLVPNKSSYVEPANTENDSRFLGVVVAASDSLLEVGGGSGNEQVATVGTANTLASSVNGNVSPGDQVSVSTFNGIGARATDGGRIIGVAETSLNSATPGAIKEQVKDKNGHTSSILVGYIKVKIGADTGTSAFSQENGLQHEFANLTGHVIPTYRIIIALVVAVVTLITLIVLMYASLYGSVISIGRNPLAKSAVMRSLSSVLMMIVMIFLVGAVVVVTLLR